MHSRLDWLSFTIQIAIEPVSQEAFESMVFFKVNALGAAINDFIFDGSRFAFSTGRAPYRYCLARVDNGCRIYGGSNTSTILVELTGRAFDRLDHWEQVQAIVAPVRTRVSRIDLATDITTDISPDTFVGGGYSARFKSNGRQESETGITCYVGSASSDCFARVYRYSDPHPRSAWLRVECVYRRDLARSAARAVISCNSIQEFTVSANRRFGWGSPEWNTDSITDVRIEAAAASRDSAGTVYWLYKQVAPALRKLMENDQFDLTEWLMYVQGKAQNPFE